MAFWLKLCGGILLILGIAYVLLTALTFAVWAGEAAMEDGEASALVALVPASLPAAILLASGVLACGTILYFGGRSLTYMDRQTALPTGRGRPVRRRRPQRIVPPAPPPAPAPRKPLQRVSFCTGCGNEISWDDHHCRHCGTAQPRPDSAP